MATRPSKKPSAFDGYVGVNPKGGVRTGPASTRDRARGMAAGFSKDYEGMRTSYDTYRKPSDPPTKTVAKKLAAADERTARTVQRTGRDADNEMTREKRRGSK